MKKTLIHFLYEQGIEHRLPHVYLDMDGVLVDLEKGAYKVHGAKLGDVPKPERWDKINAIKSFWKELEWMPGAKRLYQKIMKYNPYILSAYSGRDPTSRNGKMKWLAKNTDFKKSNILLVMRSQKQKYATTNGKPNVLIDDYIKNIKEWESKGGIGVHHTSVGKSIGELNRLGFK